MGEEPYTGCLLCERKSAGTLGLVGLQEFLSLDFTAAFRIRFHSRARPLEEEVKHLNGLCEVSRQTTTQGFHCEIEL